MRRVERTPQADSDLLEIWFQIRSDGESRANDVLRKIEKACTNLGQFPESGRLRDELLPGVRSLPVAKSFLIFYRIRPKSIEITRVLHGSRDLKTVFNC